MAPFITSFSDHLGTNYVPDDLERLQIPHILEEPIAESRRLQDDISRIEESLNIYLAQRQHLRNIIDEHERLLSPFRRVTDDVLREIFLFCLPSDHNAIMSIHEAPFLLCLVCSRWKCVAYSTPRLWSTIHIPLPIYPVQPALETLEYGNFQQALNKFDDTVVAHCSAISTWINRSGACPLSISFHPGVTYPVQAKTHLKPYLDTLLSFSSRWHNLEITILTGEYSTVFASIPASSVPILETLSISFIQHWQDWGQPHASTWIKSGLINPPSLRKLYFYHFPFPPSTLEVDWTRLTRLEIPDPRIPWQDKGLTLGETYTLFSHCQNLTHISIDVEDSSGTLQGFDPISLPHLESIDILDAAPAMISLFHVLDLPSLRHIRFQSLYKPVFGRPSPLTILLACTRINNVETLTTNLQMLTCEDFLEIIRWTAGIKTFSSESCRRGPSDEQSLWMRDVLDFPIDFIGATLGILSPYEGATGVNCLWPNLTHLNLGKVRRVTDASILQFIETRMKYAEAGAGVAKLESVKIHFYRDMMEDIKPALAKYTDVAWEEGGRLKLDLVYPSTRIAIPGSIRPRKAMFKRSEIFRP